MPPLVSFWHRLAKSLWPEVKSEIIILEKEINTLSNTIDLLRSQLDSVIFLAKSLKESNDTFKEEIARLDMRHGSIEIENIRLHEKIKILNNDLQLAEKINLRNSELKVLASITHKEAREIKVVMFLFFSAVLVYLYDSSFTETVWLPLLFGIMAFIAYLINLTAPIRDQLDGKLNKATIKKMQPYMSPRNLLLALTSGIFYALGVWSVTNPVNILGLAFSLAFLMVPALLLPRRQGPET